MTLEEAILHAEEVAEAEEQKYKDWKGDYAHLKKIDSCLECAKEHLQLAEWLKELKHRRSYENGCQYCKYKFRSDEDEPCIICSHNYTDKFKDDGTREVNANGDNNCMD
jgi:hypothetical protein